MSIDIVIPNLGESITEGTITTWLVEIGEAVALDQPLLELETDKVTAELPAPVAGVLTEKLFANGDDVEVGATVGRLDENAAAAVAPSAPATPPAPTTPAEQATSPAVMPAARSILAEHGIDAGSIQGTGKDGRVTKGDALAAVPPPEEHSSTLAQMATVPASTTNLAAPADASHAPGLPPAPTSGRGERRVKMTRMRRAIATRLKDVQNTAAILTTFNEVDMSPVMELRSRYKQPFLDKHGVKLGFMSFFVKAAVEALKEFPAVNAYIDGDQLLYHDYYDIGVAVSSERGLVVPVIRDADRLSFAEVEKGIGALAGNARDGSLTLSQLEGGTFSITNGGIFGSMLSTPILNAPQSAILGMHNIVRRPWVVGDEVQIRPIMYLALSYDHRIVDGSQAVRFLVTIKNIVEDPTRLLLEI